MNNIFIYLLSYYILVYPATNERSRERSALTMLPKSRLASENVTQISFRFSNFRCDFFT